MASALKKEGGDITIADMVTMEAEPSQIQRYFSGSTVFITGATGFIGKLIMEKLLRSCSDLKKVYILIRPKKGNSVEKRLTDLLDNVLFDQLRREQPKFLSKIELLPGDCSLPDLGLSNGDKQKLIDEANCIFHCAATVRFDEKIRTATHINVRATRDALRLCREMKHLKSFVHISTAFSNCIRKDIDEKFYEPAISGNKLITLVDTLDEEMLNHVTPILLGKYPNTYVFTKCIAEEVVKTAGKELPVAMVRPAIVIATVKEPVAGWIDNIYGPTGVVVGTAIGLIRALHCKKECLADMVPADFVINCVIAAAWDVGITKVSNVNKEISYPDQKEGESKSESNIPIYNYVSSTQNPITWADFNKAAEKHLKRIPSPLQVWHYCFFMTPNYYLNFALNFLLHKIPAYIVDFGARCIGKEPLMVKGYKKIDKFLTVLSYFTVQQWDFKNHNTQALWKKLNGTDQHNFDFDMGALEWDPYFFTYARGGRVYLLRDPLDTLPQGRIKYVKLQIAHYTLVILLLFATLKLFMVLWSVIF